MISNSYLDVYWVVDKGLDIKKWKTLNPSLSSESFGRGTTVYTWSPLAGYGPVLWYQYLAQGQYLIFWRCYDNSLVFLLPSAKWPLLWVRLVFFREYLNFSPSWLVARDPFPLIFHLSSESCCCLNLVGFIPIYATDNSPLERGAIDHFYVSFFFFFPSVLYWQSLEKIFRLLLLTLDWVKGIQFTPGIAPSVTN